MATRRSILSRFALGTAGLVAGASLKALPAMAGNGNGNGDGGDGSKARQHRRTHCRNRRERRRKK